MEGFGPEPLARARHLVEQGALAEAQRLVRRAVADEPSSAPALTLAGQIAIRSSTAGEALRHFHRANCASRLDDPRSLLNLARARQMAGEADRAVATARQALELFSADQRPRGLLALLHAEAGNIDEAAAVLQAGDTTQLDADTAYRLGTALKHEPRHHELVVDLLARAASTAGRFLQKALRDLAVTLPPNDPRCYHAARRYAVLSPDAVDGMHAIGEIFKARRYLVKQAVWNWQSYCASPGDLSGLKRVADLLHEVKWPAHGIAAGRLLLQHNPNNLEVIYHICDLFIRHRELSEDKDTAQEQALAWGRSVLDGDPRDPRIWDAVAGLYKDIEAFDVASTLWRRILRKFPRQRVLYYNYGLFLDERNRLPEAIRALRSALMLSPDYYKASNLLSLVMARVHRLNTAVQVVRWAIVSQPGQSTVWLNYGSHLRPIRDYGRAIDAFEQAERLAKLTRDKEQEAAARFNIGMTYLSIGELGKGFNYLEARWATKGFPSPKRNFRQPIWLGPQRQPGASLLAYMEQGMGDEVMMSWYLPLLRRDTERLAVDCDERLVELFSRTYDGIEFLPRSRDGHAKTRDPALTHKIPIVHVPQYYVPELKFLMRNNWEWARLGGTRFPARLVLEPDRLARWDRWLEERFPGRPRVAISWRSKMRNRTRDQQYLTTDELAAALPEGGVAVNLQYSSTEEEIAELHKFGQQYGFEVVTPEGVDLTNDLEDIFALLQVCDAAVTPMISLAWMAGAVGCPGYIFRTSRERVIWQQFGSAFVPWAPSLRLFFRDPSESWEATIRDLNRSLTQLLAAGSRRYG